MKHYYAFANNLPLIDRRSLKVMIHDLTHFYKGIGQVNVVDETGAPVWSAALTGKRRLPAGQPSYSLLAAVQAIDSNPLIKASVRPVKYGEAIAPPIFL